jgi:hypothetical protein
MPFGLKNAAQTFQRLMDQILRGLPYVFVYLDDILIASRDLEEHQQHLRHVLAILQKNGLIINPEKCVFAQPKLEFLGHQVCGSGLAPLDRHVAAVQAFPAPCDVKQLQRFVGFLNFYRRFLPGIAGILKPLTDAVCISSKEFQWSEEQQAAFEAAKLAVVNAVKLTHPIPAADLSLATDASDYHVGGVLQQRVGTEWQPLSFFSKKLTPTQQRYSTFDRELLAAFLAIRHFRFWLEGRKFQLHTDHKPLVAAVKRISPPWSDRQQRHLSYIAEFTADVRYVPGKNNVVADVLSRPSPPAPSPSAPSPSTPSPSTPSPSTPSPSTPSPSTPSPGTAVLSTLCEQAPIDYLDMAVRQIVCPDVAAMRNSTCLEISTMPLKGCQLFGDISTGRFRPLVPTVLRKAVFDNIHGAAHPGMRATCRLMANKFVWPGMAKQVREWARQCVACQRAKAHQHVHTKPEKIEMPGRRFSHLHVDLVGPLPPSEGHTHLFTIVDRATRWPEAIPLRSTSAAACATALFHNWVARFGVPDTITSDRGPQFTSQLWSELCQILNIKHNMTTAYHPESNGMVERMHRRLKDALRARASSASWLPDLPWVLLGLRTTPREDTGSSAAEAVFGSTLTVPGEFLSCPEKSEKFFDTLKSSMSGFFPTPPRHNISEKQSTQQRNQLSLALSTAKMVFVKNDGPRKPLAPLYNGPYLVLERHPKYFIVQMGEKQDKVTVSRLQPAAVPDDTQPAAPPQRGRPRTVSFKC